MDQLYEDYEKAHKLFNEDHPEKEPFKFKYEAKEILEQLSKNDEYQSNIKGALLYFIGKINYETEDRVAAEQSFKSCLNYLDDEKFNPKSSVCYIKACNDLAVIHSEREQSEKSLEILNTAKKIYVELIDRDENPAWDQWEILRNSENQLSGDERKKNLESVHTHTLFFLAQATKTAGQEDESADYCGQCLKRQLDSGDFVPKEWALHSACLSQYYLSSNDYFNARHCLRAAVILFNQKRNEIDQSEPKEKVVEAEADIYRCWIKYLVYMLENSTQNLMFKSFEEQSGIKDFISDPVTKVSFATHPNLDLSKLPDNIDSIPYRSVETLKEANQLHKMVEYFHGIASKHFILDGFVTDNVELTQDLSKSWKHLAEFDTDLERRCKMHKRRIDMNTNLIKEINPQFYLAICRQIQYEIGETYTEMADLKISLTEHQDKAPTMHQIRKINVLANSGIKFFTMFTGTMKEPDGSWPEEFDDLLIRPFLMANFHTARLYSKFISIKRTDRIEWTKKSWDYYKLIIDIYETRKNAKDAIKDEIVHIKEMNALMPKKLDQIAQSPTLV